MIRMTGTRLCSRCCSLARWKTKTEKLVAAGDKAGNFWILDAESGKLVNNLVASFQKNAHVPPSPEGNVACPNTLGGIEYQGGAYDPATNAFYIPSQNECGTWTASQDAIYIAGQFYIGGTFPKLLGPNTGQMNAIDVIMDFTALSVQPAELWRRPRDRFGPGVFRQPRRGGKRLRRQDRPDPVGL